MKGIESGHDAKERIRQRVYKNYTEIVIKCFKFENII